MKSRDDLTFSKLVSIMERDGKEEHSKAALDALHSLQPNFKEWVAAGKVKLEDCEMMHSRYRLWTSHVASSPRTDLN